MDLHLQWDYDMRQDMKCFSSIISIVFTKTVSMAVPV